MPASGVCADGPAQGRSLLEDLRSPDRGRRESAEVRLWTLVCERAGRIARGAGRRDIQATSIGNQVYGKAFQQAAAKAIDDAHLVAFVTTCATRVVLDRIRSSRRSGGSPALEGVAEPQARDPEPAQAVSIAEERARDAAGLSRLAEDIAAAPLDAACIDCAQQLLVRGLSRATIARSRGETPAAVRQRLHRCRDDLLDHLLAPLEAELPSDVVVAVASTIGSEDHEALKKASGAVTPALLRRSWRWLEDRYGSTGAERLFLLLPEERAGKRGPRVARQRKAAGGKRSGLQA